MSDSGQPSGLDAPGAFRALVHATTPTAYRLALRILRSDADARDAVQETYARAWQGRHRLRDPAAAPGWIYRICRNVSMDRARARARMPAVDLDEEQLTGAAPSPEQRLAAAQASQELVRAIDSLKDKHRIVVLLRDVDGMTYEDIATALGVPVGTVESRLHRGRAALAKALRRAELRAAPVLARAETHEV